MTQVLAATHSEELFIKRSWALDIFALAWSDIRALQVILCMYLITGNHLTFS